MNTFLATAMILLHSTTLPYKHTPSNTTAMQTDKLTNPAVRTAIQALADGKADTWFSLFTDDAELYDDGNKMNFRTFFTRAIGHERFTSIDKVEHDGLHVYGRFHADQWGDFKTCFKFYINAAGRIYRLDIGQASY